MITTCNVCEGTVKVSRKSGLCKSCVEKARYEAKKSDPEFQARRKKNWAHFYEANKEELKEKHRDRLKSYHESMKDDPSYKARRKQNLKRYDQSGKRKAVTAKRRAAIIQRTPPWADQKAISKFYQDCPPGHEVDHIVPLQGKNVCGLHALENLQYLPISANRKKSNHFPLSPE